jgi:transcription antitermination factor NusG
VEVPVFKNYVFVQVGNYQEYVKVLQLDGVASFVKYLDKPAVVSDEDMIDLKEFIDNHEQIALFDLHVGKAVIVTNGALKGQQGIVRNILTNKVILELPKLGFKLEARIDNISVA